MRAVVDTNILVRAMLNPGGSVGPVVDFLRDGRYVFLYSEATLNEMIDVPKGGLRKPDSSGVVPGPAFMSGRG